MLEFGGPLACTTRNENLPYIYIYIFTGLRHSADPFSSSEGKVHGSVGSFRWKDLLNCLCVVTRGIVFLVRFECVTLCRHPLFWPSQNRVLSFWTNHSECLLVGFFHVVFGMCYIPSACVNDMPPPEKGRFVKPSVNMAAASCLYIVCRNDVLQT